MLFPREASSLLRVSFQSRSCQPALCPTRDTIPVTSYFSHISYFNFSTSWFFFPPGGLRIPDSFSELLSTVVSTGNEALISKEITFQRKFVIPLTFDFIFILPDMSPYVHLHIFSVTSLPFFKLLYVFYITLIFYCSSVSESL